MENINKDFKKNALNRIVKTVYGIPLFLDNGNINIELKEVIQKYQKLNKEFDDEDDILSFIQTKEDCVKFFIEYCLNEIDSIHASIRQIARGQHNDRIADILSASEIYERVTYTNDVEQKKILLMNVETTLISGLNKVKKEIEQHITTITNLPKGRLAKLFCGAKVSQIENNVDELKEAFFIYQQGVFLILRLDAELGETKRAITSIKQAVTLLDIICENAERLNQFDIQNEAFWLERPQIFYQKLDEVQKLISSSEDIFEMEG